VRGLGQPSLLQEQFHQGTNLLFLHFHRLVRGDLDRIVMKAQEKDRARRYGTTSDFAQDLERYLRREPVVTAAPSSQSALCPRHVNRGPVR
jgi:hypothetical protein